MKSVLSSTRIGELIKPFIVESSPELLVRLSVYLDLLVKWNARTNLTAVRDPERMVTHHFGESLFLAGLLPKEGTMLDLGSGAGFPGLPVQLAHPALRVTLAESQNKKAAFLREVIRTLDLTTEVWSRRVEEMPQSRKFDVVVWRAVDDAELAGKAARLRVREGGLLGHIRTGLDSSGECIAIPSMGNRCISLWPKAFHVEH